MHRTSRRAVSGLFIAALLVMLVLTISPTLADVDANFDNLTDNTSLDSFPAQTIPGIDSMVSDPPNSTNVEQIANLLGGPPFDGEVPVNLEAGAAGTLTITFNPPQASYIFDFATNNGSGTDTFTVEGKLANATVFTDDYPVTAEGVARDVASGSEAVFDQLVISSTTVEWAIDNLFTFDQPGVRITESGGSTDVTEGGATDTYEIALNIAPSGGNVVIDLSTPDGQCTVSPNPVTFTAGDFTPKTVTVTAVNDGTIEASPHDCLIGHAINTTLTTDNSYDTVTNIPDVVANVTDNDTPGITLTESGNSTDITEGGVTDSYTLVLDSQPASNVTITATPDTECTVDTNAPGTSNVATFTTANWNVAQIITVTAANDSVAEGAHTCTITHVVASGDANYNNFGVNPVVANITDNDTASITIAETSGGTAVTEGGATDTYTIVLGSQPTDDVVITAAPSNSQCDIGNGPGASKDFTFTNVGNNFSTPQTVTVTAVNDTTPEAQTTCVINHSAASTDPTYNGFTPITGDPVTVTVNDDDNTGVTITESSGTTAIVEGGATDTYTIVLTSQPSANVAVTASPDAQCTVDTNAPGTSNIATFTTANWNVAQTVTVTAVNDAIAEGAHNCTITHTVTSTDPNYNVPPLAALPNVVAAITDNDTAGITLTQSGGTTSITEGGSDSYTLVLTSQPTSNVVITATPSNAECDLGNGPGVAHVVTFTTVGTNFSTPQTVTVTARAQDSIDQDDTSCSISHAVVSSDGNYNNFSITGSPISVPVLDNDTAGVNIAITGGTTVIAEVGTTDTYTIVLTSQPTADVTITATPDSQCTVDTNAVGTSNVATFTSANWDTTQIITITAVNDAIDEGAHTCTITHTIASTDAKYNVPPLSALSNVVANITDNDTAGVTITQTGTTAITEGGTTDTYTIVLKSQPTANVAITAAPNAQCTVDTDAVGTSNIATFTTANWNTPQTITVTAVDDAVPEATTTCTIAHTISSTDPKYNVPPLAALPNVVATVTDNDGPPSPANAAPVRNYYTTQTPTLTWTRVTWAIRYEIQIASNATFTVGLQNIPIASGSITSFTLVNPLTNGVYYWRIRACSSATICGPYSVVEPFTIAS